MRRAWWSSCWLWGVFAATIVGSGCNEVERRLNLAMSPPPQSQQSAGGAAFDPSAVYRRSIAVVIGIDAYEHLDRLQGAVRDAQAMSQALRAQGFEVTSLFDADASLERLREVLGDRLRQQLGPDDRVLVYFAGHGASVGQDDAQTGYLMPVAAKSYLPFSTGISMNELVMWLNGYASKHVMFVADACYSGLALSTRGVALSPTIQGYVAEIARGRVRFSLVAGAADQEAHEWENQGVFTHFLLEGMQGAADFNRDGLVTSDELAGYVRPQVADLVRTQFQAEQLPQSGRSGTGEFIFFVPRAASVQPTSLPTAEQRANAPLMVVARAGLPPVPSAPPPLSTTPSALSLNPVGIWNGPDDRQLRIQREGKRTLLIGTEPNTRVVLGMIEHRGPEALFEGSGRVLSGPDRGRFLQLVVRLTALDAYSAQYRATYQPLDGNGLPVGASTLGEPVDFRWQPPAPSRGTRLNMVGNWVGGEDRRVAIESDDAGGGATISCSDRWGSFTGQTRMWLDDEAVFDGKGEMAAGPRKGTSFRVAVRLSAISDGALSYEPVIQYLDAKGVPTAASLLGYSWPLQRSTTPPPGPGATDAGQHPQP